MSLSEEDRKIAEELQAYIGGDLFDDVIITNPEKPEKPEKSCGCTGGDDIKYKNTASIAISDSNDMRRIIADMLKT